MASSFTRSAEIVLKLFVTRNLKLNNFTFQLYNAS